MAALSTNLPQPKTFAPSREDVLSTLGFFFGDPAVPEKLKVPFALSNIFYKHPHTVTHTLSHTLTDPFSHTLTDPLWHVSFALQDYSEHHAMTCALDALEPIP